MKTVDELMRLADDASAAFFGATRTGNIEHAESKRATLRSALEEVVKDAERKPLSDWAVSDVYRKWADTPGVSFADLIRSVELAHRIGVDAAMQQAPEQEG